MKIIYNSKEVDIPENTPVGEVFKSEIENSKFPIIGAKFNNEYKRLDFIPNEEGVLSWVDVSSKGGMKIYRKTLIFIMAKAFEKLYKQAKIRVNYQLAHAMFCTIENMEVTDEILENVQKEMREIVDKNLPITNKAMNIMRKNKRRQELAKPNTNMKQRKH